MSLSFYLDKGASLDPGAPCLTIDGTSRTYGEVVALSRTVARALRRYVGRTANELRSGTGGALALDLPQTTS